MDEKNICKLQEVCCKKQKIKKFLDLKKNCWIGTGGIANNTFFPEDEKDLHNYLKIKNNKIFYFREWIKYSFQRQGYSGKIIKLGKGLEE